VGKEPQKALRHFTLDQQMSAARNQIEGVDGPWMGYRFHPLSEQS
jgi:hypothetical protein